MPTLGSTQSRIGLGEAADPGQTGAETASALALSLLGARSRKAHECSIRSFDRDKLYAEFAPLVKRLLRQYGTEPELRQDLAGEIYCRFCAVVEAFDPERGVPLKPYIVRQLTASTYTYVRGRWNQQKREAFLAWPEASEALELSYDPTPAWLADLSHRQILSGLPGAIAELPERQRKVVCWRYYDELPFEEIAKFLGVEPATARSLLRHGLASLRKKMQHPEGCASGH